MRGLEAPPKQDSATRLAGRMIVLLLLLGVVVAAIFTASTNQRIDLTEITRTAGIELQDSVEVDGVRLHISEEPGGPLPVLILHDEDVSGSMPLADLSQSLDARYKGVRVDLAGFGFSDRITDEGPLHTAAGMAELTAGLIEERFGEPVLILGIGFGGEVGADLALTYPHLVDGLVLVDTDPWESSTFTDTLTSLPFVGRAATFTWETGGRYSLSEWSPYCEEGGWCPTAEQIGLRDNILRIAGSTDSLYAFNRTREAALAPSNLEDIQPPVAYVWSVKGDVPEESVERLEAGITGFFVVESDSFQAQFEDFAAINSALDDVEARS